MAYYWRIFCRAESIPALRQVLEWAASDGFTVELNAEFANPNLDTSDWPRVELVDGVGKRLCFCELNRQEDIGGLFTEEVKEFLEELASSPDTPRKAYVIDHLVASRYVIAFEIPVMSCDDACFDALASISYHAEEALYGLLYVDGEGFWEGRSLIMEWV
jgi:hypothetical protein